jgi:hypothetical protein
VKFIGKFGEYLVLSRLLERGIEAYPAIKVNQDSYDLTAIAQSGRILRVQVKATDLRNKSTNNSIGTLARTFDFLAIVAVRDDAAADCYVLTHQEAHELRGDSKQLGISRIKNGASVTKTELDPYREAWHRIGNA